MRAQTAGKSETNSAFYYYIGVSFGSLNTNVWSSWNHKTLLGNKNSYLFKLFGLPVPISNQMSNNVCLLQKRKVETVPLATQVSPATPVPSLPSSAEASQASVFPAVRETNTFKAREDHDQLSSLTTVKKISLGSTLFELRSFIVG